MRVPIEQEKRNIYISAYMTCAGDQEVDIPIGAYRRALNRGAKFDRAKEESGFL